MQLIYRGESFNFAPISVEQRRFVKISTLKLLYRGSRFDLAIARTGTKLPNVINWRYCISSEAVQILPKPAHG